MIRFIARTIALVVLVLPGLALAQPQLPTKAAALQQVERMADWQLAHLDDLSYISALRNDTSEPRDWQQATFWVALTHVADRSRSPRFRQAMLSAGRRLDWRLGDRPFHADDHLIGAAWLWAAKHGAGPAAAAPVTRVFAHWSANLPSGPLDFGEYGTSERDCSARWCWCDALFMAPPTILALANATGNDTLRQQAIAEYRAVTEKLFSREHSLFFRDSRFFDRKGPHGEPLFWSRGNGWVFSGLARLIPLLPAHDPARPWFVDLFKTMAAKLVTLQRANGYWPPSLLGDPATAADETSGTGFFVHGLAWGIKAGLLDRATYLPAVIRGWDALQRAIQPDGRLGFVQQVSDRPDQVAAADTQFYGVGAYLLAGSAVYDLAETTR